MFENYQNLFIWLKNSLTFITQQKLRFPDFRWGQRSFCLKYKRNGVVWIWLQHRLHTIQKICNTYIFSLCVVVTVVCQFTCLAFYRCFTSHGLFDLFLQPPNFRKLSHSLSLSLPITLSISLSLHFFLHLLVFFRFWVASKKKIKDTLS